MRAFAFWKTVAVDHADFLERVLAILNEHRIRYCVVGGQAVNAYAEPVVSLDLDIIVATGQIAEAKMALDRVFKVEAFPHTLNVTAEGSDLRVQIQTDSRYAEFLDRAVLRKVLGIELPVARLEDVLEGKIWAVQDPERRRSKRQKDLADIARLLEAHPHLRSRVPADILSRLV